MTAEPPAAIRPLTTADAPACDDVIRSLPYHFGDPYGQRGCAEAVWTSSGVADGYGRTRAFYRSVGSSRLGCRRSCGRTTPPCCSRCHWRCSMTRVVVDAGAWKVADQLGWASTYDAEYIALTQLQADAFVALDAELARSVRRDRGDRAGRPAALGVLRPCR